jgi:CheY-like chemotaxis protein
MSYVHHTILVVDSNPDDAHFTTLALQRVGVISPVRTVRDADEALSYLAEHGDLSDPEKPAPVLMLLELQLSGTSGSGTSGSGISGLELLAWVRRQPVLKRLPVIVLTSSRDAGYVNLAYDNGCNSYLVKPTSFNALLVIMQSLVQYWLSTNVTPELCPAAAGLALGESGADAAPTNPAF